MKIRAIIVDDEELARHILREYLSGEKDIDVVAECANGFDAVKAIAEHKPDLLFLDVQMPKLDGFEVLELAGNQMAVVFVTAYDRYAMKPFDIGRFRTALERARRRLGENVRMPSPSELENAARAPGQYAQRIVVKDGTRVHIIQTGQLDYAEAQDDYVALHSGGKTYLKQQTISSLESSLDPECFIRVHRSFILNLERVVRIESYTKDTRLAILADGSQIPVSRAGYLKLKQLMERG